jgi:nitrite reductase/ring-hydroxylating ferredoxin subunit
MTIPKTTTNQPRYVFAANLKDVETAENHCLTVQIQNHTIVLYYHDSKLYAMDNRCPHMGFPLNRGTIKDGILTCHWHHARFDLMNGGTFDQWAGDVPTFPVQIRNGNSETDAEVWLDISECSIDKKLFYRQLLQNGLKQNIPLMIAKSVIALSNGDEIEPDIEPKKGYSADLINAFKEGLEFGTRFNKSGWGQGLTIHTCMMNILPVLNAEDRAYALYHGLSAIALD